MFRLYVNIKIFANKEDYDAKNAPPHHTPDFMVDDSKLYVGVKTFCQLVMDYGKMK